MSLCKHTPRLSIKTKNALNKTIYNTELPTNTALNIRGIMEIDGKFLSVRFVIWFIRIEYEY